MSIKSLIAFSSISPSPPCFVIPVFSDKGSNLSYVQDLTLDGQIKSFMLFDTSRYENVPVMAPPIIISEGALGVVAFWLDNVTVITGSLAELSVILSDIDEYSLPPFVAVEAMTLVGDQERLKSSSNRAASLFACKKNSSVFLKRAPQRAETIYALIKQQSISSRLLNSNSIDDILRKLQTDLTELDWSNTWKEAWQRHNYHDSLLKILEWKLYNFPHSRYHHSMLQRVAYSRNEKGYEFVIDWLERRDLMDAGWRSVWMSVYNLRRNPDERLLDLGLNCLFQVVSDRRSPPDYVWTAIWSALWRRGTLREELLDLAHQVTEWLVSTPDTFISLVIVSIIRSDYETPWADRYADRWLRQLYGYKIWKELFVVRFSSATDRETQKELCDSAVRWLSHMGQGMNTWEELWSFLRKNGSEFVSQKELAMLADGWLRRARKDLSSWPNVFETLYEMRGNSVSREMVTAAKLWIAASKGSRRRSPLIRACADGELRLI